MAVLQLLELAHPADRHVLLPGTKKISIVTGACVGPARRGRGRIAILDALGVAGWPGIGGRRGGHGDQAQDRPAGDVGGPDHESRARGVVGGGAAGGSATGSAPRGSTAVTGGTISTGGGLAGMPGGCAGDRRRPARPRATDTPEVQARRDDDESEHQRENEWFPDHAAIIARPSAVV